ncbi:MAG: FAD-dependent oxidoreductase [Bacteroidetes bacterium]|nr:FAD-dependent oxidoreductase [Bacteroidota bacterium]MBU1115895.1 FAD-dependent oxidoreductase [Bacteroidota bacterium]MBU1798746.1 FAD-dependent oxidoreductase [Bacteroidota bacterium]
MLKLRNQFILAPVKLGYSDGTGVVTEKHLHYYDLRSKHIGAVNIEPLYMDAGLRELPTQLGIDNDNKIIGLKSFTELIHKNGAKAIANINHAGRMANPKIPENYFWSSSNIPCPNGGATPIKMNREMMDKVKVMFIESSKRAVASGFDIIEIQFGHGYLLAQFISSDVNDRTDEYGGSFENRIKFPIEVFKAVREAVKVPIIARISGDEMIPTGYHIDEMIKFSKILETEGIDAIHVSAGSACATPPWFFQHMFVPKGKTWELASNIKENVKVPVIFVGRINSKKDIEFIKNKFQAYYIAIGRAMIADHNFIGKYLKLVDGNIRPCLACAEGCLGGVKAGKGLGCVVNPLVNTGLPEVEKAKVSKRYAVIGGGLAGMEAAITLKERGHLVDLFEKNELGGQFNLAYLPPNKESLKEIVEYLTNEIKEQNINLINKTATAADFENKKYDGIILATGAVPSVPPIKGLKKYYWTEFLEDSQLPKNKTILVVGGGLIGLEVASKLVDGNNNVIIVEMLDEIARDMEIIEKAMTIKKLQMKKTEIITNHKVVEVNGNKVIIIGDGIIKEINDVDEIVIAAGMKSYIPFEYTGNTPIYKIGDALKVGKAQEAIHEAYALALNL